MYLLSFLDFFEYDQISLEWPKMTSKMREIPKFPDVKRSYATFVTFLIDFVD